MADEIQRIDGNDANVIINTINSNFEVLKKKISQWNASFSYWDVLQISQVFQDTGDQETRLSRFVANVWTGLENYKGVYIETGNFTFQGHLLAPGDYLIKLPGEESIYISGTSSGYYYPTYNSGNNSITWSHTTETSTTTTIPIPVVQNAWTYVTTHGVTSVPNDASDVRWFYQENESSQLEEIFWNGDGQSTSLPADLVSALPSSGTISAAYYKLNS